MAHLEIVLHLENLNLVSKMIIVMILDTNSTAVWVVNLSSTYKVA